MGDETIEARLELLSKERESLGKQLEELTNAVELLDYKISRYREAVRTGVLTWDMDPQDEKELE